MCLYGIFHLYIYTEGKVTGTKKSMIMSHAYDPHVYNLYNISALCKNAPSPHANFSISAALHESSVLFI